MCLSVPVFTGLVEGHPDCWIWMGVMAGRHPQRGRINIRVDGQTKTVNVPRLVWEIHNKQKLQGKKDLVRHMCNVAACVNPYHLINGSESDNVQDALKAGRHKNQHGVTKRRKRSM
jgi:hypothetical protein